MDGQEVFEFEIWRIFNTLKFSVFLAMIRNREILIIKFSKFSTIAKLTSVFVYVSYETYRIRENDTGKYANIIVYAT